MFVLRQERIEDRCASCWTWLSLVEGDRSVRCEKVGKRGEMRKQRVAGRYKLGE